MFQLLISQRRRKLAALLRILIRWLSQEIVVRPSPLERKQHLMVQPMPQIQMIAMIVIGEWQKFQPWIGLKDPCDPFIPKAPLTLDLFEKTVEKHGNKEIWKMFHKRRVSHLYGSRVPYAMIILDWIKTPTEVLGYIPQVSHTYALIEGTYPFMNEYQVGMGESSCAAKLWTTPMKVGNGKALFNIGELMTVALERSTTARQAIQVDFRLLYVF